MLEFLLHSHQITHQPHHLPSWHSGVLALFQVKQNSCLPLVYEPPLLLIKTFDYPPQQHSRAIECSMASTSFLLPKHLPWIQPKRRTGMKNLFKLCYHRKHGKSLSDLDCNYWLLRVKLHSKSIHFLPRILGFNIQKLGWDLFGQIRCAAMGLVVGNPEKADIKELLLAESILKKLPTKLASIKEILYQKCLLTVAMICKALNSKSMNAQGTSSKLSSSKEYAQYARSWHNPATTRHTKQECYLSAVVNKDTCFLDSCASHHMLSKSSKFNHYKPCHTFIELADRNTLKSVEEGYIQLLEGDGSIIQLKALHIPQLAGTLISFGRLFIQGCNLVRNGNSTFNMVEDSITLLLTEVIDGTCNVKLVQSPQGILTKPLKLLLQENQSFHTISSFANHHATTIKTVLFDGGGEFNSKEFTSLLSDKERDKH
ncbi:uncharacterized protein VP01_2261g1 [Puccinia sorghi]|uniref:Retrovirus-related Pol polyprotein from transposon TNT 1-94-like beta-barrel domain-containing protein n=1 Tax=Puccinia sorghi TaxID=27349 RepID=A0A0L6VA70_9BASI|nr:uncharacterized protein VP01_2261g1 [Puccinia sorghi]